MQLALWSFLCWCLTTICHPSFFLSLHQVIATTSCLRNKKLRVNVSAFFLCPALCSVPVPNPINLRNGLQEKHIAAISPVCLSFDQLLASDENSLLLVLCCSFHRKPSACGKCVIKEKWQGSESDGMVKKQKQKQTSCTHLQCYCLEWCLCPNDNHILPSMA